MRDPMAASIPPVSTKAIRQMEAMRRTGMENLPRRAIVSQQVRPVNPRRITV